MLRTLLLLFALFLIAPPAGAGELREFLQSPGSRQWGEMRRTTDVQAQPCDCRCALFKFGPAWTVYRHPRLNDLRPEVDADVYQRNLARNLELRQAELASCDAAELRAVHEVLEAYAIDPEMTEAIGAYLDGRTPIDLATADSVVRGFYATVLTRRIGGLPNPAQQETIRKYLTPEFAELLMQAQRVEDACAARTPTDIKPPLFEGSQFVGNYEGATEVVVGPVKTRAGRATVESRLFYLEPDWPKGDERRVLTWTDRLSLNMANGQWAIADVLRGGVHERSYDSFVRRLQKFIREVTPCAQGRE
jgi:hypothetical protein